MFLKSLMSRLRPASRRTRIQSTRSAVRLQLEPLEDRLTPSGGHLLVTSFDTHHVPRYDGDTGAFVDAFVARQSGGLNRPYGVLFGPQDGDLYVTSGQFGGGGQERGVLRYDGDTGAFLGVFAGDTHLNSPRGMIFGPEGDLYVADFTGPAGGRVVRFDGTTGAFLADFVPTGSGGLDRAQGLLFGPDANGDGRMDLYVASADKLNAVLCYDGAAGTLLGAFVPEAGSGLDHPTGLTFGPDGNLYVSNYAVGAGHTAVLRFQGPAGPNPGAPLPSAGNTGSDFVPVGAGGLQTPFGILFGPDGNGDGRQDLYVTSHQVLNQGSLKAKQNTSTVLRYDGTTGAFIGTFVTKDSGGLREPSLMTFTETDPMTLAYTGTTALASAVTRQGGAGWRSGGGGDAGGEARGALSDGVPGATVTDRLFSTTGSWGRHGSGGEMTNDYRAFAAITNTEVRDSGAKRGEGGDGPGSAIYNRWDSPLMLRSSTFTGTAVGDPGAPPGDDGGTGTSDVRGEANQVDALALTRHRLYVEPLEDRALMSATLAIGDAWVVEGTGGTSLMQFTVTLVGTREGAVTVDYATADGTASKKSDYTATSGTLTFAADETVKTISVEVKGDNRVEMHETVQVNLSGAVFAEITDPLGIGVIYNDDYHESNGRNHCGRDC